LLFVFGGFLDHGGAHRRVSGSAASVFKVGVLRRKLRGQVRRLAGGIRFVVPVNIAGGPCDADGDRDQAGAALQKEADGSPRGGIDACDARRR
jgi:hypothetical protein